MSRPARVALRVFAALALAAHALHGADAPALRLPEGVRPLRYGLELWIDPEKETFRGIVDVDLDVAKPGTVVWMNGSALKVSEASVSGRKATVRTAPGVLGLELDSPLRVGKAHARLAYTGEISSVEQSGVFRQKEKGLWYVFTHFEAIDARRAFPCFDEPAFKVPFQLTLHVPSSLTAVSNTPVLSENGADGTRTVRFKETAPLPSYLLAFGVGPFDVVDGGTAGAKKTPIRFVTMKGRGADAAWAREATPPLLDLLEKYFGTPYPYEKLDFLAVPQFLGAEENAGLVTYYANGLLADAANTTTGFKRTYASISAHEMAHQWFGDLVTTAWWDDIWLNEAFASWLGEKTVDAWQPAWGVKTDIADRLQHAMTSDGLVSARKIRQPIADTNDIESAFDAITYDKGSSVLGMFESYMGEETFRRGVRRYIKAHGNGSATSKDFLEALSAEAGGTVAPAFTTFLDQPGVPVVSARLLCDGAAPRLALSQKRFLRAGAGATAGEAWRVPVCVRYGAGAREERACLLMSAPEIELPVGKLGACPDRVVANDGEAGYYRVRYEGDLLPRLLARGRDGGLPPLSAPERVGVFRDAVALAEAGQTPIDEVLGLLPSAANDPDRHVVDATLDLLGGVWSRLLTPEDGPRFARFLGGLYGERARSLGFTPKPGESDDTRLLRGRLVAFVADAARDEALLADAARLSKAWLKDRSAVDAESVGGVLRVAAQNGGAELFDIFLDEAKKAKSRRDRDRLYAALGRFRDPALVARAFPLTLDASLDARETSGILWSALAEPASRVAVFDFVTSSFDALTARVPRDFSAHYVGTGQAFCDPAGRKRVEDFFKARVDGIPGGPRRLAQTLEVIDVCTAFRAFQEPRVAAFLKQR